MTELKASAINKPKTRKGKQIIQKRLGKVIEDPKKAILIRTTTTTQKGLNILRDLYSFKKPDSVLMAKKNDVKPFEVNGENSLEFLVGQNDGTLFAVSSHTKKRPDNLILGRTFDGHVLDMAELAVESYDPLGYNKSLSGINKSISAGSTPLVIFQGEAFETQQEYTRLKNLLLDWFGLPGSIDSIRLPGIEHVISFVAHDGKVYMKTFKILLKKSGTRYPRAELEPLGPNMTFSLRRTQLASDDHWRKAIKAPSEPHKNKMNKNKGVDEFGQVVGKVHMKRQDYGDLQTRKVRALKKTSAERKLANVSKGPKGLKRPLPAIFKVTPAKQVKFNP